VAVVLDDQVVGVTDANGRFSFPSSGRDPALLSVIPPTGWQWTGKPMKAQNARVVIPLHRLELAESETVTQAATTATVAGSALVVALLVGLVFNGAAVLLQTMALRSITHTYRRQKSQELELAMAQELATHQQALREELSGDPRAWQETVRQLLADVRVSHDSAWMQGDVTTVFPSFAVVGADRVYTFTTDPDRARGSLLARWRGWRDRVIALDTTVSPFARVDAQAVWGHLAAQRQGDFVLSRRNMAWYLVVQRRRRRE
jgi:hypothetical protein